jgi:hypothetical protein
MWNKQKSTQFTRVAERLREARTDDLIAERQEMVARWRAVHPEAAAEPASGVPRPLELDCSRGPEESKDLPDEEWFNDVYHVTLRRLDDHVFGTRDGMIQLGISSVDGTARHDWREFQAIKNQLAGVECEAFELYPAESRKLDPSNYYVLWCFPGIRKLKVGTDTGRRVWNADEAVAPQRAFHEPAAHHDE